MPQGRDGHGQNFGGSKLHYRKSRRDENSKISENYIRGAFGRIYIRAEIIWGGGAKANFAPPPNWRFGGACPPYARLCPGAQLLITIKL